VLGTIFIFVLAAIAGAFFAQSSLLDRAKTTEQKEELLTAKDKATIMIMGVDERSDDVGRSDTLMVATIDPARKEAALLSIPRDTRVAIPRNGYDKINAAYAYGGEQLTRYVDMLDRDPLLTPVRGLFAAQQIRPQARVLAEDRGIRCVVLDYDAMRGLDDPSSRLF